MPSSRSPHGERGLKYKKLHDTEAAAMSLSTRRAWIEMYCMDETSLKAESLSTRRAWIEIQTGYSEGNYNLCRSPHGERGLKLYDYDLFEMDYRSLSTRRAWIEISDGF